MAPLSVPLELGANVFKIFKLFENWDQINLMAGVLLAYSKNEQQKQKIKIIDAAAVYDYQVASRLA